ncbi:MAG: hypothetical protein AB1560_09680 [Pseudomonadota bacterium]
MNSRKNPAAERTLARLLLFSCLMACAGPAPAQTPAPPPGGTALEAWLKAGRYKTWRSESGPHASQGPHFGKVRAWLNPVLFESLQARTRQHPPGAVAVKELYGEGETVQGWSVAIKTAADSAGGSNWYWYEIFQNKVIKDGQGILLCRGCHFTGNDYVLTPWPLK